MSLRGVLATWTVAFSGAAVGTEPTVPGGEGTSNYHTPPPSAPAAFAEQHRYPLISPLEFPGGRTTATETEWFQERRPQIALQWKRILGKIAPTSEDAKWFGDIGKVEVAFHRSA